jgi:hypothetical protein
MHKERDFGDFWDVVALEGEETVGQTPSPCVHDDETSALEDQTVLISKLRHKYQQATDR